MQVSQIFLSDYPSELPPYLNNCVEAVRQFHPEYPYVLYNSQTLRKFIVDNFDAEVVLAYDKLNPYAYKADLGRYCLLYKLGGWYFDISVNLIHKVDVPDEVISISYRDNQIYAGTSWACNNGIIFSRPNNPVFRDAIEIVIENCKNEYYGITPLCPTGPNVLGQAFARQKASPNMIFGDLTMLTPSRQIKNVAYVLPDGLIHGFFKPSDGGNLSALGARGTNNYNEMYASRSVYKR